MIFCQLKSLKNAKKNVKIVKKSLELLFPFDKIYIVNNYLFFAVIGDFHNMDFMW